MTDWLVDLIWLNISYCDLKNGEWYLNWISMVLAKYFITLTNLFLWSAIKIPCFVSSDEWNILVSSLEGITSSECLCPVEPIVHDKINRAYEHHPLMEFLQKPFEPVHKHVCCTCTFLLFSQRNKILCHRRHQHVCSWMSACMCPCVYICMCLEP